MVCTNIFDIHRSGWVGGVSPYVNLGEGGRRTVDDLKHLRLETDEQYLKYT